MLKYKRVLLKLSGEALKGDAESGLNGEVLVDLATRVAEIQAMGCKVGIVIGGGNFWRYRDQKSLDLGRVTSDTMGMMATVMNALAFESALKKVGAKVKSFSALRCPKVMNNYSPKVAREHFEVGDVVIFAGGTGNPFFTTDSAAALRALEMECEVLLKATTVDYVYDKDPREYDDAKILKNITFRDVLDMKLGVMDDTCASLLDGSGVSMLVFNLNSEAAIREAVVGNQIGTFIK